MSSRAPAAAAGGEGADRLLWAKAAELERDFAGYKRRLAERRAQAAAEVAAGRADEEERCGPGDAAGAVGIGCRLGAAGPVQWPKERSASALARSGVTSPTMVSVASPGTICRA